MVDSTHLQELDDLRDLPTVCMSRVLHEKAIASVHLHAEQFQAKQFVLNGLLALNKESSLPLGTLHMNVQRLQSGEHGTRRAADQ